jgi:dTDP-4-dehydrorhamnose reductase
MTRFLVTGGSGQLGAYLVDRLRAGRAALIGWSGQTAPAEGPFARVDLTDRTATRQAFCEAAPDVVIHAAAIASQAAALADPKRAWQVNVSAAQFLCELATARGAAFVYCSTDLVFDGERAPYREEHEPRPLSLYARSKHAAEEAILAQGQTVLRLALLYGPSRIGRPTMYDLMGAALQGGAAVTLFRDEWRTPLAYADAAEAIVLAALAGQRGLFHVGGPQRLSRHEMGCLQAEALGLPQRGLVAQSRSAILGRSGLAGEPRPRDVSLDSSRFRAAHPDWRPLEYADAIRRGAEDRGRG